ncbi:NepR family anti-sigma factor [Marivita hallyeonensis]|uniref:Anti-sigma factor NepR domain-containing protein n=1 Tax=Marivita hallyeonensis TaxID=996342 RepID=A0A1M5MPF9_9RHOB|nr:NepR family anti-sigma factor [Marivita hallyeonensis]SHG79171.1 hypothetical protein SAMN05443551_0597 [Marivita hallyeonensis]
MTQTPKNSRAEREINDNLKRAYDDVIQQPVPDRFTDLLAQLKQAEAEKAPQNARGDNADQ